MRDAGRISLGTLVLLSLLAGGIYAAVIVVPLYVDNFQVQDAVNVAHNMSGRVTNDALLRTEIISRTQRMGQHWGPDEYGRQVLKPGMGLTEEQILIQRNPVTSAVRIEVNYSRVVRLRPSARYMTMNFNASREGIPTP